MYTYLQYSVSLASLLGDDSKECGRDNEDEREKWAMFLNG